MNPRLAIVGGGPAGMMAAIRAAEALGGQAVVLFDKNDRLGRKIYLTGKGRCNLTNRRTWEEFAPHIHPNQGFLKNAFRAFSNEDLIRFFETELSVPTVTLQGQRVYPASLVAGDVARALERRVRESGVDIRYRSSVGSLAELRDFDAVIIATGGKSYPVTGSTGDGYRLAEEAGHTITATFPSETALLPKDYDPGLPGLEMKNVGLTLCIDRQEVMHEQGDFNFTDVSPEPPRRLGPLQRPARRHPPRPQTRPHARTVKKPLTAEFPANGRAQAWWSGGFFKPEPERGFERF